MCKENTQTRDLWKGLQLKVIKLVVNFPNKDLEFIYFHCTDEDQHRVAFVSIEPESVKADIFELPRGVALQPSKAIYLI